MGLCKFIRGSAKRLPFVEYVDECGNRYFVDILSKPWFYIFASFRICFPVNAYRIDTDLSKKYAGKDVKNMWIYMSIGTIISKVIEIFLKRYVIIEGSDYSKIYQLFPISFIVFCVLLLHYNKNKILKNEKLAPMNRVTIKLKPPRRGMTLSLICTVLLYGLITFDFTNYDVITIYEIIVFIGIGFFECLILFFQWTYLEFSSKDVKPVE